jgi:tetratricopeptide (TPR) repeat protein
MISRRAAWWNAIAVFAAAWISAVAGAQPVRTRILDHLDIEEFDDAWEVRIAFTNPVRYLRHAPQRSGRDVTVQLENIAVPRVDIVPSLERESLRPAPGANVPLSEVVYEGAPDVGPTLELHFARMADFEVRQGEDFRSLVVVIHKLRTTSGRAGTARPGPTGGPGVVVDLRDGWAVQLQAARADAPLPEIPALPLLQRNRVYTTTFIQDGVVWRRLRVGFFASEADARAALVELQPLFPDAWVAAVARGERVASEAGAIPVPRAGPPPSGAASAVATLSPEDRALLADLMRQGRDAMTAGDVELATRLFTKVLTYPENEQSREAKELLGLARQRRGQLAHAKAEYEEYLERYPEGEGAERVRQRLQAMLTARKEPEESLRPARSEGPSWTLSGFGSLSSYYRRAELLTGPVGAQLQDSSSLTDVNVTGRARRGDLDVTVRAGAQYRYDLMGNDPLDEGLRVGTLFVQGSQRAMGLRGTLGRQSANSGGVLGRFDGLSASYTLGEASFAPGWQLGVVAGFPVDFTRQARIDTSRRFAGLSLGTPRLFDAVDGEIWGIGQLAGGSLDRAAVGGELRYAQEGRNAVGFVDYDVYFGSLNTALLIGNWSLLPSTDLNFTLDYRNTPVLSTSNALLGQPVDDLDALGLRFSGGEIKALAVDRTPVSKTATLGATHRLTDRFQINADATVTEFDGTPASGGVQAILGTGLTYLYDAQFIANGIFLENDVMILGLRASDGRDLDTYGVTLNTRIPFGRGLRLSPRISVDYLSNRQATNFFSVRPVLRLDWRLWQLSFSAEGGWEWLDRPKTDAAGSGGQNGYYVDVGVRFDFD